MTNHFRCIICNKVNNTSVQTDMGDYISNKGTRTYVQDYKHEDAYICYECDDVIQETLYEYHVYDMEQAIEDILKDDEGIGHDRNIQER